MRNIKRVSLLLSLISIGTFTSCHKSDDPCSALHPTSADFTIMEDFSHLPAYDKYWPYYACDTVATRFVRFTAKDSTADSYEWHIGTEIYTTRKISLNFSNSSATDVPVTLILRKKPNLNCFPKDDGVDTLKRNVHFVEACQSLISGKYLGSNSTTLKDTFSITIETCKYDPNYYSNMGATGTFINNFYPECGRLYVDLNNLVGYKAGLFSTDDSGCQGAGGSVLLTNNNSISINYGYYSDSKFTSKLNFKFKGTRINK